MQLACMFGAARFRHLVSLVAIFSAKTAAAERLSLFSVSVTGVEQSYTSERMTFVVDWLHACNQITACSSGSAWYGPSRFGDTIVRMFVYCIYCICIVLYFFISCHIANKHVISNTAKHKCNTMPKVKTQRHKKYLSRVQPEEKRK